MIMSVSVSGREAVPSIITSHPGGACGRHIWCASGSSTDTGKEAQQEESEWSFFRSPDFFILFPFFSELWLCFYGHLSIVY